MCAHIEASESPKQLTLIKLINAGGRPSIGTRS